ncbi:MAG: phage tail tape measure protein, partial [Salinibacterium sp.]
MSRSLGAIRIDLLAGTASFTKDIGAAKKTVDGLGTVIISGNKNVVNFGKAAADTGAKTSAVWNKVKAVFAGVAAAFAISKTVHALNDAAETVDKLGKKAAVLGVPIEKLSALRFAAGEANIDFDQLSSMVGKATRQLGEFATTGGGKAAKALQSIGVGVRDANGNVRSIIDMLPEIARGLSAVGDPARRLNLAEQIFGKGNGEQFVQLLEETGGALEGLADEAAKASKLGVIFSADQAKKLKEYNDSIYRIGEAWLGVKVKVMTQLAPALTELADKASAAIARLPDIATHVFKVVGDAIGGDAAAKARLKNFVSSLGDVIVQSFKVIGSEAASGFTNALSSKMTEWGEALPFILSKKLNESMRSDSHTIWGDFSRDFGIKDYFKSNIDDLDTEIANIHRKYSDERWKASFSPINLESTDYSALKKAFAEFSGSIDDITGWTKAVQNAGVEAAKMGEKFHGAMPSKEDQMALLDFYNGLRQGFKNVGDEAQDAGTLGINVAQQWTRGIGEGLAGALVEAQGGFKNLGSTALKVLEDITKAAIKTILQMQIMAAVAGLASYL